MNDMETNGTFSASGYGSFNITATGISHGMTLDTQEEEGKNHKAFYFNRMMSSDFAITLKFRSSNTLEKFSSWLLGYARRKGNPNGSVGPMRVVIPSRGFDKTGIPNTGIEFGDEYDLTAREGTIVFRGTTDPIEFASILTSRFVLPKSDTIIAPYLYPAGIQLSGSDAGEDLAYDLNIQMGDPMVPTVASGLAGVKSAVDDLRNLSFGAR